MQADKLSFGRKLQSILDLGVRLTKGTGISAAIVVPGRGTWAGASGRSQPSEPIAPDMLFDIASIGKHYVAILVVQLAQEGRLGLVVDADTSLPGSVRVAHAWWDADRDGALEDITSRPRMWIATRSPAMICATAEDLARWAQAIYGGTVLDQTFLRQVLTFHRPTPTAPGGPFATGYGLGTQELRLGRLVIWGHLGWQYGYTSSMLYVPKHSASIAVLINDNNMMLINLATVGLWIILWLGLKRA